jgi:phosphoribosyl 1,2-cyclic phosphodiesterase
MKITIRGVRGSIPTADPYTVYYGGNTSCAEVAEEEWQLVLDGGSGMRYAHTGPRPANRRIDILLTHLHLDHIIGLGFFQPLFDPSMDIHIWGPASSTHSLRNRLTRYLSPPLFPVMIRNLPSRITLHEIGQSEFSIGPFSITSEYVIHPGPTIGYRIKGARSVFTYIPDHEPAMGPHGLPEDHRWVSGFNLAAGADLLLHDSQYSSLEYSSRKGWGHSSMEDSLRFASMTGVKRLLLAHHDPEHSDAQLDGMLSALKQQSHYPFLYELAREGMEIELS